MYQTAFPLPFIVPLYKGRVIVPFVSSTLPDCSNCSGPTKLGLLAEGGGPKYDRQTDAPTEAGAGSRLHPGPGPIGPGPGPWAVFGFTVSPKAASTVANTTTSIPL